MDSLDWLNGAGNVRLFSLAKLSAVCLNDAGIDRSSIDIFWSMDVERSSIEKVICFTSEASYFFINRLIHL